MSVTSDPLVVKVPNRDFDGSVIPYDEPDIKDEDEVIRRIHYNKPL